MRYLYMGRGITIWQEDEGLIQASIRPDADLDRALQVTRLEITGYNSDSDTHTLKEQKSDG